VDSSTRRLVGGRYRLHAPLGVGGMGTVWRAEDELLGREVAVKEVLFPAGLSDRDREVLRERTRREARAAARLDHPSAVTVYDVVEQDGSPYLVMELVEARTLSEVVRTDGPLSPQRTAHVGLALLGALETAHRQGIVHRDVKPGNVLLGPDVGGLPGRVVLTDFGIASTAGDASITSTGLLLGSPAYIAPERARGHAPGPPSDLWSLGATLFTAVEGRPPYDGGGDPLLTVTAVVTGEHEPYVAAGPLEPVLEGLLERDPARRLPAPQARAALRAVAESAATVAVPAHRPVPAPERRTEHTAVLPVDQLAQAAAAAPPDARPARPAVPRPVRPPAPRRRRRTPWAALLLVVAILALGGAIVGYVLSQPPADDPTATTATPVPSAAAELEPVVLPDGWTRYEDPQEGWSIGVPPGYERSDRNGQVQFRNDEQRRTLRIEASPPRGEPLEVFEDFSRALEGSLQDYEQLRLEPTDYLGQPAADLEFTYFDTTTLRVLDRTFVDESGTQAYALYWQVHSAGWDEARPVFDQLLETFRPRP
jgi:hypothetical protein